MNAAFPSGGFLLGLMLLAGLVGAYVARLVRVPRVLGFMAAGIGLKAVLVWYAGARIGPDEASAASIAAETAAHALRPVTHLALGMILFTIGGVFEAREMRSVVAQAWRISLCEVGLTVLLVLAGSAIAAFLVVTAPVGEISAMVLMLGAAAIATAPAATLLVLQEYQAKGPMTETTLTLVGFNNILSIVLFHTVFVVLSTAGVLASSKVAGRPVWLDLAMITVGSVVLGCLVGIVISLLHAKLAVSETLLVFLALMIGLGAGRDWLADPERLNLSYSFLLTCLAAGATFANEAVDPERLGELLATIGVPIYAAFFVLAGYNLHLEQLLTLGWVGGAYAVFRVVGKVLGGRLGARWVGHPENIHATIGLGLLCQAGVAIGLAEFLRDHWDSPLAGQFYAIILGSVALFELVGPLALKHVARTSGEVKAITLLRRPGPVRAEGLSATRVVADSMLRLVRHGHRRARTTGQPLRVRDIMRSNVRFLRPEADLDEVLHFVETSRLNHFPVVSSDNQLTGVIDYADVRDIIYDPMLGGLVTALDLANPDSPTVGGDASLDELLELFRSRDLGCVPVVEAAGSRKVVGLVEQRDLLRALHLSREEARL